MCTPHQALFLGLSVPFFLSAADPPAHVDEDLKSRVQNFYQLEVDRKFRQAEEFVAADTKDFFYGSNKPNIQAFKIVDVQYAPDFQSAKVRLSFRTQMLFPGAAALAMDLPSSSDWKIDDGKWCWYVDQSKLLDTPFGRFNPTGKKTDGVKNEIPQLSARTSVDSLRNSVHADPARIHFDPDNPKPQTVTLKNGLPGPVSIQSASASPGLKVVIAKPNLGAEESTEVTITPVAGSSDRPAQLLLKVAPTGQIIQIDLDYSRSN
jgi:hypothetical protein